MAPQQARTAAFTLALAIPAALMAGALFSQFVGGLPPCEMCWWQRYPHIAAVVLAMLGWTMKRGKTSRVRGAADMVVVLAAIAIMVSGLIGGFHAGVEYGWWEGITTCSSSKLGDDPLAAIMNAPLIRCDVAPWSLFGISLAGFNFLISLAGGITVLTLLGQARNAASRRYGSLA
jgi:disulfide bond formation protein DsbB